MSNELRAAAERRRLCAETATVYPGMESDADVLADAYLAERPADDGEPVTVEQLRAEGWPIYDYPCFWTSRTASGVGVMIDFRSDGRVLTKVGGLDWRTAPTRGDVRRLLAALGGTA